MILTAADLTRIERDVAALLAEYGYSVVFRRGNTTLPAQTVRVDAKRGPAAVRTTAAGETRTVALLVGGKTLDIAVDDRLNVNGRLYRVLGVHPDRRAFTQADVELVQ